MEPPGRGTVQFQSFQFGTSRGLLLPRSCVSTLWPRPLDMAAHDASDTAVHSSLPVQRFPHPFLIVPGDYDNASGVPWPLRIDDGQDVWFRYALRNAGDLQLMALRTAMMGRNGWQWLIMNGNDDDGGNNNENNSNDKSNQDDNDNDSNDNHVDDRSLLEKCKASICNSFKHTSDNIGNLFDYTVAELRANLDYASPSANNGLGFGRACVDGVWHSYDTAFVPYDLQRDLRSALDKLEAARERVGRRPTRIARSSGGGEKLVEHRGEWPGFRRYDDERRERRHSERRGQGQWLVREGGVGRSSIQKRTTTEINYIIDPYLFPYIHRKTAVLPPRPPIPPPPPRLAHSSSSSSSTNTSTNNTNPPSDVPWELTRANCIQRANAGVVAQPDEHLYFADGLDFAAREQFRSTQYQLLPAVVAIDRKGKCRFETYVNDLNPESCADVYDVLEKLLQKFVPMFQHVLADLLVPVWRPTKVKVEREEDDEEEERVVGNEDKYGRVNRNDINRDGTDGEASSSNAMKFNDVHHGNENNNDDEMAVGRTVRSELEDAQSSSATPTTTSTSTTAPAAQFVQPSSTRVHPYITPNACTTLNRNNTSTARANIPQPSAHRSTHSNVTRGRHVRRRLRAAGADIRETMGVGALTEAEVREALRRALARLAMDEDAFERDDRESTRKRNVREIVNALLNHSAAQLRAVLDEEEGEDGKGKQGKEEKQDGEEVEYWSTKKTSECEGNDSIEHENHEHTHFPAMHTTIGAFTRHEERPEYKAALQYAGSLLYGRTLQVIIEVSSMKIFPSISGASSSNAPHLTLLQDSAQQRDYDQTETWRVNGCDSERIVATGLCSYTTSGFADSPRLEFRRAVNRVSSYRYGDSVERRGLFGLGRSDCANQYCGHTVAGGMQDGGMNMMCVAFPNVLQHRTRPIDVVEGSDKGVWKYVKFHLIDPVPAQSRRLSTACVPPQDASWLVSEEDRVEDEAEQEQNGAEMQKKNTNLRDSEHGKMDDQTSRMWTAGSSADAAGQDGEEDADANESNGQGAREEEDKPEEEQGVQARIRAFEALNLERGCRCGQPGHAQQQQQQGVDGAREIGKVKDKRSCNGGGIRSERRKMDRLMNEKVFERMFAQALPLGLADDEYGGGVGRGDKRRY